LVPDNVVNGFPYQTALFNTGTIVGFGHLEALRFPNKQPDHPKVSVADSNKVPTEIFHLIFFSQAV
jgi:hypothetical protein